MWVRFLWYRWKEWPLLHKFNTILWVLKTLLEDTHLPVWELF